MPLDRYQSSGIMHLTKSIPDLPLQDFHIDSPIEEEVGIFLRSGSLIGLLIGPTGCGKTHQLLQMAKKQFTIYMDAGDLSDAKFLRRRCLPMLHLFANHGPKPITILTNCDAWPGPLYCHDFFC
jgi:hypothetical protein